MAVSRSFALEPPFLAELGAEVAAMPGKLDEIVCFSGEGVSGVSGGVIAMVEFELIGVMDEGLEIVRETCDLSLSE